MSNNVCHELGVFQLQSSCWFQAKTAQTTVVKNLFYNGPRAGINMNDGFGGGNRISQNVIWNQCRQSGDHGPINSWDRQLFWTDVRDGPNKPGWNPAYTEVDRNVIIANYGGTRVLKMGFPFLFVSFRFIFFFPCKRNQQQREDVAVSLDNPLGKNTFYKLFHLEPVTLWLLEKANRLTA